MRVNVQIFVKAPGQTIDNPPPSDLDMPLEDVVIIRKKHSAVKPVDLSCSDFANRVT
jgi:hypothetical protein